MNVLVVFTYGYSLETWSNSGTLFRELSIYKELNSKYNINFTFLTYGKNQDLKYNLEQFGINVLPVYNYLRLRKSKYINYLNSFLIPFYFKNEMKNISLIKQNQLLGSWVSILLKLIYRKPLFIRTGYDMYKFSIEEKKHPAIKFLYKILTKISLKLSNIYSVSSFDDIEFLNSKFKNRNLLLRRNWVLKNEYVDFDNRKEKKILSVGRLEEQKDFSFVINNLKNSNFVLDIIGEGSLKNELQKEANACGVKLNLLGPKTNEEIMKIMKEYRYFISGSKFEGNPKVIIEAMSVGCVVIASSIKNHSELITDKTTGFLYSKNDSSLNILINSLGSNLKLEQQISINSYNYINSEYSLQKISEIEYQDYIYLATEFK